MTMTITFFTKIFKYFLCRILSQDICERILRYVARLLLLHFGCAVFDLLYERIGLRLHRRNLLFYRL